jgi:drug/metabolite transporter (DMT)-like permease
MTRRGALLFAAMCVIWGIPYLMIRVAVRELAPVTLVFLRTGIAALLLAPVAAYRGELRPLLQRWRPVVAYTAVEVAIPWVLLARAETKLTSSLTGLLIAAVPLVGAVVVSFTGERERLGGRRWIGLLVGIAGVAALVGLDFGSVDVPALVEIGFVAVGYAVGPIILSRSLSSEPALGVVAASLFLTTIVYAPFAAANWPSQMPSTHVVESVLGLAVICTALAFLLFLALIAEVGPVRATVITYINPAVAAVLGVTLLGEHLTTGMVVGFALVLAGCVLATGRSPELPSDTAAAAVAMPDWHAERSTAAISPGD